jgi:hypothetical protein
MTTSQRRMLELALLGLEAERQRIEAELADIRKQLGRVRPDQIERGASRRLAAPQSPNKGRTMTAAQRRKISRAMKARWAAAKVKRQPEKLSFRNAPPRDAPIRSI